MRSVVVFSVAVVLGLVWCEASRADLLGGAPRPPRPRPEPPRNQPAEAPAKPKQVESPVYVRHEVLRPDVRAKIILPRHLVVAQNVLGPGGPTRADVGEIRTRTIVGGVLLSLAAVSAVWLTRGKRASKVAALAVVAAALVGAWNLVHANVAPPERLPDQIIIEFSDLKADAVTLILNVNDRPREKKE